jgi:alanine racemase
MRYTRKMLSGASSTWLEIDLTAITGNLRQIQALTRRPVMAVIKANAYGHGLVEVGRAVMQAGSAWCGVARFEEALALRAAGIDLPLLVMGFTDPQHVPAAISQHIRLSVFRPDVAQSYAEQARAARGQLALHVKLDSGMGRLGIAAEDGPHFLQTLSGYPELHIEGLFTHLARADEPGLPATGQQLARFGRVVAAVTAAGLRPALVHAANSAGSLYHPESWFDLVRPGIALYGLHPSPLAPLPAGFRAALAWKARLVSLKELPPDHGVSYGFRYVTAARERIGVIPVGYADGLRRQAGNAAMVGGQLVPVVGTVCMDQCMLQLDHVPAARPGDEVVLLGRQGQAELTAEMLARTWGTINYEVVCGLAARLPRFYLS